MTTPTSPLLPEPSVESCIVALVAALQQSKGWLHDYADSIVRDAIDRKHLISDAEAALNALTAEVAALRVDAERYRWLRKLPIECPTDGLDVAMWEDCYGEGIRGDQLDSAIDAAREDLQPGEEAS